MLVDELLKTASRAVTKVNQKNTVILCKHCTGCQALSDEKCPYHCLEVVAL